MSLEWLAPSVGLLRYHPSGGSYETRAPYTAAANVVLRGGRWEIVALRGQYSMAMARAIRRTLKAVGILAAEFERHTGQAPRVLRAT